MIVLQTTKDIGITRDEGNCDVEVKRFEQNWSSKLLDSFIQNNRQATGRQKLVIYEMFYLRSCDVLTII